MLLSQGVGAPSGKPAGMVEVWWALLGTICTFLYVIYFSDEFLLSLPTFENRYLYFLLLIFQNQ